MGGAGGRHQLRPKLRPGDTAAADLQNVGGVQVYPRRGVGGIVTGLRSLGQAGHDTKRHFGGDAFAIQDGLVLRQADGLREHLNDGAGKLDVAVLQHTVAHRDKSGHLVAVQGHLSKDECQLIDGTAHLRPYSLRHDAGNGLPGLAPDIADPHTVQQFAVPVHILGNQVQEHHRDGQLRAGHCPVLALHAPHLAQELLDLRLGYDGLPLPHGQGIKGPAAHGQGTNVDLGFHVYVTSHFLPLFWGLGSRGLALQVRQLGLQVFNVRRQGLLGSLVGSLVRLKGVHLSGDGGFLLGVAGLHLADGCLQLRLPGLELCVLFLQGFQLAPLGIQLPL